MLLRTLVAAAMLACPLAVGATNPLHNFLARFEPETPPSEPPKAGHGDNSVSVDSGPLPPPPRPPVVESSGEVSDDGNEPAFEEEDKSTLQGSGSCGGAEQAPCKVGRACMDMHKAVEDYNSGKTVCRQYFESHRLSGALPR